MTEPQPTRLALFLWGIAGCLLLTGFFPLLYYFVQIFLLGFYEQKFGRGGTFLFLAGMIGTAMAPVLAAYILTFWPVVVWGAVRSYRRMFPIVVAGCAAAWATLLIGVNSELFATVKLAPLVAAGFALFIIPAGVFIAAAVVSKRVTVWSSRASGPTDG